MLLLLRPYVEDGEPGEEGGEVPVGDATGPKEGVDATDAELRLAAARESSGVGAAATAAAADAGRPLFCERWKK